MNSSDNDWNLPLDHENRTGSGFDTRKSTKKQRLAGNPKIKMADDGKSPKSVSAYDIKSSPERDSEVNTDDECVKNLETMIKNTKIRGEQTGGDEEPQETKDRMHPLPPQVTVIESPQEDDEMDPNDDERDEKEDKENDNDNENERNEKEDERNENTYTNDEDTEIEDPKANEDPKTNEVPPDEGKMSLRVRNKEMDYKALSTGRADSKERKKNKSEEKKASKENNQERTENKGKGPKKRGQDQKASTSANKDLGTIGRGERAPTNSKGLQDYKDLGTDGQGERAPTGSKGLVEQQEPKNKSKNGSRKGTEKKKATEAKDRNMDVGDGRNTNEGEETPTQGTSVWRADINIHAEEPKPQRKRKRRRNTHRSPESESTTSTDSESNTSSDSSPRRKKKHQNKCKCKTKINEQKEDIRDLEKEIYKLKDKLEERRETISKRNVEAAKHKERIADQERQIEHLHQTIREMERSRERTKESVNNLQEKLRKTEQGKEDLKTQHHDAKKRNEKLEHQLRESKKKIEECESLNAELLQKITSRRESDCPKTPKEAKLKLLIVGDSNSHRIAPHFNRRNNWDYTDDTFIIQDIDRVTCSEEYEAVIFLLGTNNIKRGSDGRKDAEELINRVKECKAAPVKFIVELPPINRKGAEIERRIFNSTLHKNREDESINVIRMTREVEEAPIDSALQDDLHLTRNNAKQMASHIETLVERTMANKRATESRRNQDNRPTQTKITEKELEERQRKNEKSRDKRKDVPCKFYRQGRCHRGSRCFFLHDHQGDERRESLRNRDRSDERRTRDQSREARQQHRSRSPSRDRRRVVLRESRNIRSVKFE